MSRAVSLAAALLMGLAPAAVLGPEAAGAAAGRAAAAPSRPRFDPLEWPLQRLQAAKLWRRGEGDKELVAVVDTGIALHPDLAGALAAPAVNLVPGQSKKDGTDISDTSHGTAVAGLIAGRGRLIRGHRMTGLAPGARLVDIRVSAQEVHIGPGHAAVGILAAVRSGATVIDVSLPVIRGSDRLNAAVQTAQRGGAVVVAAAGSVKSPQALGQYPGVLVVGAARRSGQPDSAGAAAAELLAPGTDLFSTGETRSAKGQPVPGYVMNARGSGFAAAFASAAIALLLSADHKLTPGQAVSALVTASRPAHATRTKPGELNPARALATLPSRGGQGRHGAGHQRVRAAPQGASGLVRPYLLLPAVLLLAAAVVWVRRRQRQDPSKLPQTSWDQPW